MKILKHNKGFIDLSHLGALTIVEPYNGMQRVFAKVDGDNIVLFASSKPTVERRVEAVLRILMNPDNKGTGIYIWEEL